jgi:hypothetical protein
MPVEAKTPGCQAARRNRFLPDREDFPAAKP